jgi:hypothetical protein
MPCVCERESNHNGQIKLLKSRLPGAIFCDKLKKAREHLSSRCVLAGPIQDRGDMKFFEIRDSEGRLIEIRKEP